MVIPAGTYLLTTAINVPSDTYLLGVGNPTLKMADGSTANPGLIVVAIKENVTIEGLVFDGNRVNITPFNNVVTVSQSTRVHFERCRWHDTKGPALIFGGTGGCFESGAVHCRFDDIGNHDEVSGDPADRKQAIAYSGGGSRNYVDFCHFDHCSLGAISYPTGEDHCRAIGNTLNDVNGGGIYCSTITNFVIANNLITGGDGNAIDTISCKHGAIIGNVCQEAGGTGILLANNAQFITVTGNVCRNNNQTNLNHKGGVTFHAQASGAVIKHITLVGNVLYDDQTTATQYGIGITTSGAAGTIQRDTLKIDDSNIMFDRTGRGRFQSNDLGGLETWQVVNLTAGATFIVCDNTRRVWVDVVQINATQDARFLVNATVIRKQVDTLGTWQTTDTGSESALYSDSGDNTIKIKNRTALTRSYLVRVSALGNLGL